MKVTVKKKENAIPVVITTEFIKLESAMKLANIVINRKVLAELAVNNMAAFTKLADIAKEKLGL